MKKEFVLSEKKTLAGEQLIDSPQNENSCLNRKKTGFEDKPEPCNTSVYSGLPSSEGSGSGDVCAKGEEDD